MGCCCSRPKDEDTGVPNETTALLNGEKETLQRPIVQTAKKRRRWCRSSPPTEPFQSSLFGTTLEETMAIQAETHPRLEIPWIVVVLCETVLRLRGPWTEGIFRIPAASSEVDLLKLQVDKGNPPPPALEDPHIPASLLKFWFRKLKEPLIPKSYYQKCVDNCNHADSILSLINSLPDLNKKVLVYLIHFLQEFTGKENVEVTKMSIENIAMVWAPNVLRCPSDDPVVLLGNSGKEISFMRLLIMNLNTKT